MAPTNPNNAVKNASTAPLKSVVLNDGQTLSLTSKWLFVKDAQGNEVMRLAPSQSNMRVVEPTIFLTRAGQGCLFAFIGLIFFIIGICGLASGDESGTSVGSIVLPMGLFTAIGGAILGSSAWARRNDRLLYITTDNNLFYYVRTEELPELYALMEMVENWDGSNNQ